MSRHSQLDVDNAIDTIHRYGHSESLTNYEKRKARVHCLERLVPILENKLRSIGCELPEVPRVDDHNRQDPFTVKVSD